MNEFRGWTRAGLYLAALALMGATTTGCPGGVQQPGTGGTGNTSDGGGGAGGAAGAAGAGGVAGAGGMTCQPQQEVCDGMDNDCDGQIDNGQDCQCNDGQTQACYSGTPGTETKGECHKGTQTCAGGKWGACEDEVVPKDEECNSKDDDCNDAVDDMGLATCGIGECAKSVDKCLNGVLQQCVPGQPTVEVCDGKDNNCNQLTDESDPQLDANCMTGMGGVCAVGKYKCTPNGLVCTGNMPSMETCDGTDNDCDGIIDNNIPGTGGMCSTGENGVCSTGQISCKFVAGSYQIDCFSVVPPSPEVCDGLDNNCNGTTDENDPGGGAMCMTGSPGICGPGVQHCVNGAVTCVPNQAAQTEVCDGMDNNCDGAIDEGNPGGGLGCGTGLPGACATGTTACSNGAIVCNQTVQPAPEACDGIDNDCNGLPDDGNPGGGAGCDTGLLGVCQPGTITCTGGQLMCVQNVQASSEICGNAVDENCDGVATPGSTVYFNETFANNMAGWTLDANWSIGPTVMSAPNTSCGIGDPAQDHTPTADNGVAGNVLGGNIAQVVGGPYYLTSPIINTASAPSVYLEYWRWLHSDYPNFMVDTVEVYNGSSWNVVWQNPSGTVINDTAWTKMSHNITQYKSAQMRVRFSYLVGSTGVFLCAGWNIDDVQVLDVPCN